MTPKIENPSHPVAVVDPNELIALSRIGGELLTLLNDIRGKATPEGQAQASSAFELASSLLQRLNDMPHLLVLSTEVKPDPTRMWRG